MNERIKELLGQAYDEAVPETWTTLSSEQLGRIYDKFAQLIVQECINLVNLRQRFAVEDELNAEHALDILVYDIEQHFGVDS